MDTITESALKVDSGEKIPCRTGKLNLPRWRAGPMLYQLSYIPTQLSFLRFLLSSQSADLPVAAVSSWHGLGQPPPGGHITGLRWQCSCPKCRYLLWVLWRARWSAWHQVGRGSCWQPSEWLPLPGSRPWASSQSSTVMPSSLLSRTVW